MITTEYKLDLIASYQRKMVQLARRLESCSPVNPDTVDHVAEKIAEIRRML